MNIFKKNSDSISNEFLFLISVKPNFSSISLMLLKHPVWVKYHRYIPLREQSSGVVCLKTKLGNGGSTLAMNLALAWLNN